MDHPKWPKHEWDDDCCCIHCGLDGADMIGEKLPPCPVHHEDTRTANRHAYIRRLADERSLFDDSWLS